MTTSEKLSTPLTIEAELFQLAAIICRREVHQLERIGPASANTFRWMPENQAPFSTPIGLDNLELTGYPKTRPNFSVVAARFNILGDDEMHLEISRRDEEPLQDDAWTRDLLLEPFKKSYTTHSHRKCLANFKRQAKEQMRLKQQLSERAADFKFTDKRHT